MIRSKREKVIKCKIRNKSGHGIKREQTIRTRVFNLAL